jgi:hypothetical protein
LPARWVVGHLRYCNGIDVLISTFPQRPSLRRGGAS